MGDPGLSRRQLLAAGAACLAAPSFAATPARQRGGRPPNFLFIMADDLGAADLSCYGRPDYTTRNIDRLCAQGVKLTQSCANSSSCSPTRVALLSGRYQNRLAVGNYDPLQPGSKIGFPPGQPTLPSVLRDAGYATGLIGKWHLGEVPGQGPLDCGYDEFFGCLGSHIDYFSHGISMRPGEFAPDLHDGEKAVRIEGYATDLFSNRAVDFIARHRAQPFLLSLHYTAPHWPWQSPRDPGGPRLNDFHFDGGSPRVFAEMMQSLDEGVARVLAALERAGLDDDTIVVFTSDNGGERFSYLWPLRGGKLDVWEGGLRVPTIVRWPGRIGAGSVSDQLVMSMDWLPSFAAVAGATIPEAHASDGVDVMPAIAGQRASFDRTVFWRTQWSHAARAGHWKYVSDGGHEYLFDLSRDPGERANLRLRSGEQFAQLKRSYAEWDASMAPIPDDARFPREFFDRMEALEPGRAGA